MINRVKIMVNKNDERKNKVLNTAMSSKEHPWKISTFAT